MTKASFGFAASLVAAAFLAAPAIAADLPLKAPVYKAAPVPLTYNWSGFYAGGHIGYLWGRTRVEEDGELTEPNAKTNGVVGGVLGGYNFQSGSWVFGVEADIGWSNARGTGENTPSVVVTELPNTYKIRWTSHGRGRFGYAVDRWLWFVAGGVAVADFNFIEGGEITSNQRQGAKFVGGSIGGGLEYAFTDLVRGRLEYLYDDFGHKTYVNADGDSYRVGVKAQTLRGALVIKLGQ
jgi:outer membrane immunogenic protein